MTRALPAARSALSRLVLVVLLLGGALSVLGAPLDLARTAAASVRDAGVSGPSGDRTRATTAQASRGRGTAESGPQPVRVLLRAAVVTAGALVVPAPEAGSAGAAPLLPPSQATGPVERPEDSPRTAAVEGVSDRAPPLPAGT